MYSDQPRTSVPVPTELPAHPVPVMSTLAKPSLASSANLLRKMQQIEQKNFDLGDPQVYYLCFNSVY